MLQYTRQRLRQHTQDSYVGVPLSKFPEDLRVYEHLLWMESVEVVVELGVQFGGSSLWFRDRLHALGRYRKLQRPVVIGVDLDVHGAGERLRAADPSYEDDIKLIQGDVADPDMPARVAAHVRPGASCLVVEDTAHTYETTRAGLEGYSGFVRPGGFLVVEDGCVDDEELRVYDTWPRGVLAALNEWLAGPGSHFKRRHDLETYGVTCHPGGFLQRWF